MFTYNAVRKIMCFFPNIHVLIFETKKIMENITIDTLFVSISILGSTTFR